MKSIFVVGAGQHGSRHLQALKAVSSPLDITVIDPTQGSLDQARARYEEIPGVAGHTVHYLTEIPESFATVDVAIVASRADVRRSIVEALLNHGDVRNMVLEKLLFSRRDDYAFVRELLAARGVMAWTNCSMRSMPFYAALKPRFEGDQFVYSVTGSRISLVSNAIHYIDHMLYLSGSDAYRIETGMLDRTVVESKRKGLPELTGTLAVHLTNGSVGFFTCFAEGDLPATVSISSQRIRLTVTEPEGRALLSDCESGWKWQDVPAPIPFQSQLTTAVVENILNLGKCDLPTFELSARTHLTLLDGLLEFLNSHTDQRYDFYPFT